MNDNPSAKQAAQYIDNITPLENLSETETVDLAGYQVTKAELFAHSREPSITLWADRIKFSMACLKRFPVPLQIRLLI